MNAATHPPARREFRKLVVMGAGGALSLEDFEAFAELIEPGSLLVLNDAATLPASLSGRSRGKAFELRLARRHEDGSWTAIVFAEGSWRQPTEARTDAPELAVGERVQFGELGAEVVAVDTEHPRMLRLRFDLEEHELVGALHREGRMIQYSYLDEALPVWSAQTLFAARAWAVEMPSAGHPITAALLGRLRARGVEICTLTHAAGLSSTGDPQLDARLPLPERFEVPKETAAAVERARRDGRPVIAVGTTVVRALESAARACEQGTCVDGGAGVATLRLGPDSRLRSVDAILTGLHAPGESHFELLRAFAPRAELVRAMELAIEHGLHAHEFGDLALVRGRPESALAAGV